MNAAVTKRRLDLTHEHFVRLAFAGNLAEGRHMNRSPTPPAVNRPICEHMTIAALGIFNVTNEHTFGILFQRPKGAKGDANGRRAMMAAIVLH